MTKNDKCRRCGKLKSLHSFQWGKYWCNESSSGMDGLDEFELKNVKNADRI